MLTLDYPTKICISPCLFSTNKIYGQSKESIMKFSVSGFQLLQSILQLPLIIFENPIPTYIKEFLASQKFRPLRGSTSNSLPFCWTTTSKHFLCSSWAVGKLFSLAFQRHDMLSIIEGIIGNLEFHMPIPIYVLLNTTNFEEG